MDLSRADKLWGGLVAVQFIWVAISTSMAFGHWGFGDTARLVISFIFFAVAGGGAFIAVRQRVREDRRIMAEATARMQARMRADADFADIFADYADVARRPPDLLGSRAAANERAEALLQRYTTEEQYREWKEHGYITVEPPPNFEYMLDGEPIIAGTLYVGHPRGVIQRANALTGFVGWCVYPVDAADGSLDLPKADITLALKLWIENQPQTFFHTALPFPVKENDPLVRKIKLRRMGSNHH